MKKLLVIVIIFALCFTVSACGAKKKINEAVTEKLIENAIDGKIDINGEDVKLEKDGETYEVGEDLDWPSDFMKDLPVPKGKVVTVMSDKESGSCTVALAEFELDNGRDYVKKLKELGFTGGMDIEDGDGIVFSGTNSNGEQIMLTCNTDANEGCIGFSPKAQNTLIQNQDDETTNDAQDIDMTDVLPWPDDFIKGLPEPMAKITDVVKYNDTEVDVHLAHMQREDALNYVEQLKKTEFIVEPSEISSADSISYIAYNEKGDNIEFSWGVGGEDGKDAYVYIIKATE